MELSCNCRCVYVEMRGNTSAKVMPPHGGARSVMLQNAGNRLTGDRHTIRRIPASLLDSLVQASDCIPTP